jgi:LacI family transcriptional regulator
MKKLENTQYKKVTLKDIAEKCGVSFNTVSRALNDKDDISEKTKKFINETATSMGYIRNSVASSLRSGYTKTITLIIGDISNPAFSIMGKKIEVALSQENYNMFIINTDEDPKTEYKAVISALSKNVDGIILCPTQKDSAAIDLLKQRNIPFILMARRFDDIKTDYVVCDDENGGFIATEHLIKLGHKDILFVNAPSFISSSRERFSGYRRALETYNIPFKEELVTSSPLGSPNSFDFIKNNILKTINFSAVFTFNDVIAWQIIYALNKLGYRTPEDIEVVGFDDIQSDLLFPLFITSVSSSKTKMAKELVNGILKKIKEKDKENITYINEIIPTTLKIR